MPPIRKGDGTAVVPKGISQVRTGDGRILFDGPALPDSVVLPESNDLDHFDGPTTAYDINDNSPVIYTEENDLSLKLTSNENPTGTEPVPIYSTSGLDRYPQQGEIFSCFINDIGDLVPMYTWAHQANQDDYYGAMIFPDGNELRLLKGDGSGGFNILDSTTVTHNTDTWYDVETEWRGDGFMEVTLYDLDGFERDNQLASVSGTDTDWGNGGVGFGHSSSSDSDAAWDFYRITEIL